MKRIAGDVAREVAVWTLFAAGMWGLAVAVRAANLARARARARTAADPLEEAFRADRWRMHAAVRTILEERS